VDNDLENVELVGDAMDDTGERYTIPDDEPVDVNTPGVGIVCGALALSDAKPAASGFGISSRNAYTGEEKFVLEIRPQE
jgi:hypothetical protein